MNDQTQREILSALLLKTERKYLTDESVREIILSNDERRRLLLELIDAAHQNAITSLKLEQYRRAEKFLFALNALCRKCFERGGLR